MKSRVLTSAIAAAILVAGASVSLGAQPGAPRLELSPCPPALAPAAANARCGTLSVYENRARQSGRRIDLRVLVLPATGPNRAPDPVFFIAGGPGSSIVAQVAGIARDPSRLRERRDLVLVDQRGTGGSSPINCPFYGPPDSLQSFLGDFMPLDRVRACREAFARTIDLTQYTTTIAVGDLDEVRAALGAEQINLSGGSYGTRAAQEYMRRYPTRVRTASLYGVVPPSLAMPQHFARDAQVALDHVIAECGADEACRSAFPRLSADVTTALATLRRAPARVTVDHPRTGRPTTVSLSYDMFTETLRYMLYSSVDAGLVPVAMHAAASGDFTWWARRALRERGAMTGNGMFDGLYLAITCAEDVPRTDAAKEAVDANGTFLGYYRMRQQRDACGVWGRSPVPRDFHSPVSSRAAVLLVSGANDPVTPPRYASAVAAGLENRLNVVVPFGAHSLTGLEGIECIDRLRHDLIERGSVAGLETGCVSAIRRKLFPVQLGQ